jgi:septal ring factor EnvC (AmiA/AmiB activator)
LYGREVADIPPTQLHLTSLADNAFEDDRLEYEDEPHIIRGSEEDYESEEEMIHPLDRRNSLVGLSSFASSNSMQPFSLPPFSSLRDNSDNIIDRMHGEIASLRHQSAEAVSLSLQLTEQLAHAQAEASRMRAALRSVESMLENEGRKRREAERAADNEERRRRKAEEVLRVVLSRSSNSEP